MRKPLITLLAALALMAAAFFVGRWSRPAKHDEQLIPSVPVVTTQWRTQRIERARPIAERPVSKMYVPVKDTLRIHDTLYLSLVRTQKEYRDSLYAAWVSGIEPELDSLQLFIPEKIVTITLREKPKCWHLGVTAGYGATLQDKAVRLSPYVGVGLTYSLISF